MSCGDGQRWELCMHKPRTSITTWKLEKTKDLLVEDWEKVGYC